VASVLPYVCCPGCGEAAAVCLCIPDNDGLAPIDYGTPPKVRVRLSYSQADRNDRPSFNHGHGTIETSPFVLAALPGPCDNTTGPPSTAPERDIGQQQTIYTNSAGLAAGYTARSDFWDPIQEAYVDPPLEPEPGSQRRVYSGVGLTLGPGSADGRVQYLFLGIASPGMLQIAAAWRIEFPDVTQPGPAVITASAHGSGMVYARQQADNRHQNVIAPAFAPFGSNGLGVWDRTEVIEQYDPRHFRLRSRLSGLFVASVGGVPFETFPEFEAVVGLDLEIDANCDELAP
jgi:hypothetical protein